MAKPTSPRPPVQFSPSAFLGWAAGAIFLVPCSKAGLQAAFGYGEFLAWSGAVGVTLAGSAGAALMARGRWLSGFTVALVGFGLAVASDAVALVERLDKVHASPIRAAAEEAATAAGKLDAARVAFDAAEARHREAVTEAYDEGRTGKGSAFTALMEKAEAFREDRDEARADMIALAADVDAARSRAGTIGEAAHWLTGKSWSGPALCGFAAAFEFVVIVLAGQVLVSAPRSERPERTEPRARRERSRPARKRPPFPFQVHPVEVSDREPFRTAAGLNAVVSRPGKPSPKPARVPAKAWPSSPIRRPEPSAASPKRVQRFPILQPYRDRVAARLDVPG